MPKKIYELANELDIGAIELVEKLKGWDFNVRNHMASLSEDDVKTVMDLLKKEQGEKEAKADTKKKKVVKKKAKKKVTKKAAEEKSAAASESGSRSKKSSKKKVVTVRRKSVIRRKGSDDEQKVEEKVTDQKSVSLKELAQPSPEEKETAAVAKKSAASTAETSQESPEDGGDKEFLDSELHTFTPVYIPPHKKKAAEDEETTEEADDKDKSSGKKRLGDLAAMVTKPKAAKSRDISQLRADEELKTYSLGVLGRAMYKPVRRKKTYSGPAEQTEITEVKESKRVITIHGGTTVKELAQKLKIKFEELADQALDLNLLVKENDFLGPGLVVELASLYNYRVEDRAFNEEEILEKEKSEKAQKESDLPSRDPIITVMGHVDHGKTTLLDYVRKAKVAAGEAGGITQHIGAYSVKVKDQMITFLDTPGHAAFANMRERGAQVTDIVILVVAADDGVMPQTKESIRFCQQVGVPLIVAVNKMDKEGANPDRVKQELMEFHITPEEWGGDTQFVEISALKGQGVDKLLESVALQAEIMELKADPKGSAKGIVIESKVEQGRGPIATILVQEGTLKKGDYLVVGETWGRCRSLMDYTGQMLKTAGPSTPVQVLGLNDPPSPGDSIHVVKNEREAKKIVDHRVEERKQLSSVQAPKKVSLEDFFATAQPEGEKKILKLVVRADVQGSFEAIKNALQSLGNNEVGVNVIGGGVGAVSDTDVQLASSAEGLIIGFNMRPTTQARRLAEELGIEVKTYSIIYELINDVTLALEGMLEPDKVERYIGRAAVKDTFSVPKVGTIAGSAVIDGKIQRGCNIRLLRDGKIVYDGRMASLKRFKDDVKEVGNGLECGIALENFNDIKVDDVFEAYMLDEKKKSLAQEQTL